MEWKGRGEDGEGFLASVKRTTSFYGEEGEQHKMLCMKMIFNGSKILIAIYLMNVDEITSQLKESLMLTIEIAFAIVTLNIFTALSLFYRENDISTERFHPFRKSLKVAH